MSRLRAFMLLLVSCGAAAAAVLFLAPRPAGKGYLVDSHGRRHEIVSSRPQRGYASEILERYRRWRDPDASGLSRRDRLRYAYALLLGTAGAGFLAILLLRRGRPA